MQFAITKPQRRHWALLCILARSIAKSLRKSIPTGHPRKSWRRLVLRGLTSISIREPDTTLLLIKKSSDMIRRSKLADKWLILIKQNNLKRIRIPKKKLSTIIKFPFNNNNNIRLMQLRIPNILSSQWTQVTKRYSLWAWWYLGITLTSMGCSISTTHSLTRSMTSPTTGESLTLKCELMIATIADS